MSGSSDKSWWEYSNWIKLLARNSRITNPTGNEENEIRRFVQFIYDPARNEGLRPWLKDNFFKKSQAVGGQQFPLNNFSQAKVVVLNWSQLSGAILTITIPSEGVFTFEEGIDWFITSNNNETAKSLYSAIINSFAPVITLLNNNGIIIQSLISGEDGDLNTITTSDPVNLKISGDNFEGGSATNLQKIYVVVEMLELVGRDLKKIPLRDNEAELVDRLFPFTGNRRLGTKYLYGNIGGNGLSLVEEGGTTDLPIESTTDLPDLGTTEIGTTFLPIQVFDFYNCDGVFQRGVSTTEEGQINIGDFWSNGSNCWFAQNDGGDFGPSITFEQFYDSDFRRTQDCCDIGTTEIGTTMLGTTEIGTTDIGTTDIGTTDIGTTDIGTTDILLQLFELYDCNGVFQFKVFAEEEGLMDIGEFWLNGSDCLNVGNYSEDFSFAIGFDQFISSGFELVDDCCDLGTTEMDGTSSGVGFTKFELVDCDGLFQAVILAPIDEMFIGQFWNDEKGDCWEVKGFTELPRTIEYDDFLSAGFTEVPNCCP